MPDPNQNQNAARAAWQARMQARTTAHLAPPPPPAAPASVPPAAPTSQSPPAAPPIQPPPTPPAEPAPAAGPPAAAPRRLRVDAARREPVPTPPAAAPAGPPPKRRSRVLYFLLMAVFGAVFAVSAGMLAVTFWQDARAENSFQDLRGQIAPAVPPASAAAPEASPAPDRTAALATLHAQYPDLVGWITLADTALDYPVMYRPANEDYYLHRDVNGAASRSGVPYIEERCTLEAGARSNNLILYGHHMKNGTMFTPLMGYRSADFYAEHPVIAFDTVYGAARYEVFAAFAIDVDAEAAFAYDTFTDLTAEQFDWFVGEVCARSDVDTGIRPAYGEELLTLSTCEYSTENGRYVVCARRLAEDPVS